MSKINVRLPDGNACALAEGSTGADLATALSKSLAKQAVAMKVDGKLVDLALELEDGGEVELLTRKDAAALELIRHDLAHVMAQAVTELYPAAKPTIGPVIADGFYYDFACPEPFTEQDLARIEKRMRQIVDEGIELKRELWERAQAHEHFSAAGEPFKVELVAAIPEGEPISVYRQGDFLDLCRGPHMPSTRHAGKAFKLLSVAGSYWRGDATKARLQRIYGTAWRSEQDLKDYLHRRAEAERRDHRKLGRSMGLFHLQDETAGSIFWHPQGWTLYRELEGYIRARQVENGYAEIRTPQLVSRSLWERSGHWGKFRDNMYLVENDAGIAAYAADPEASSVYGLKPMNCPGHVMVYAASTRSYRDLPLRLAEFGSCHRCEPRGALHGTMRVRAFTQDDAHIFCTAEQVVDETAAFVRMLDQIYRDLGFPDYKIMFADRPAVRVGEDAAWDAAEKALRDACERAGVAYELNPGEGAFYGPKLEFHLTDAIGRSWQCGTFQVDFILPKSLGAEYTDADGQRRNPVMLHRAIIGSFERFIGILIEHTDGHLPLWLASPQVVVATITSAADAFAGEAVAALKAAGLRAEGDLRNEKINYKVREHSAAKVPLLAVVGKDEAASGTVTVRRLGSRASAKQNLASFVAATAAEATAPHLR